MAGVSLRELATEVNDLAQAVVAQVREHVNGRSGEPQAIEKTVLTGLEASLGALQELGVMLDSAQNSHQDVEAVSEAMEEMDRKRAFFVGCTQRRSSRLPAHMDDAIPHAEQAERVAAGVAASRDIDQLVQAYKATEALEARIMELRGSAKSGASPEPRVLDLPRARVLVARRTIGGRIVDLDEDDED
jgi:hypothetical protein